MGVVKNHGQLVVLFLLGITYQTNSCMMDAYAKLINSITPSFKLLCHDGHDACNVYESRIDREFENPDVRDFLKTFSPPRNVLIDLMQKKQLSIWGDSLTSLHPDFVAKERYVLSRVLCAKRLQNMVEQNDYSRIAVPNKYLFLTDSNQYGTQFLLCISEKVIPTQAKEIIIDRHQMKEFADVILKSRFCDAHPWNFIVDQQKRIVFIDTDIESFSHGPRWESHNLKKLWEFLGLGKNNDIFTPEENDDIRENGVCKMHDVVIKVSDDAKTYLSDLISLHHKSLNSTYRSLTQKSEYDGKNLNIAHVFPKINTWIYQENNGCKRDFESKWCSAYPNNEIFQ